LVLDLPPDPSLRDLQLPFEAQYWQKAQGTRQITAAAFDNFIEFFGAERKPRDIFRADVTAYKDYLRKKGWSENSIRSRCDVGSRFFNFLNELELIEAGYNPFFGMAPRRVTVRPR
jgi:hypothetical protein